MALGVPILNHFRVLFSVAFPQMYLWIKFEDSVPFGFLETELNATKNTFSMFNHP